VLSVLPIGGLALLVLAFVMFVALVRSGAVASGRVEASDVLDFDIQAIVVTR
jgi:hypothetical protein